MITTRIYHLAEACAEMNNGQRSSQNRKQCRDFFFGATESEQTAARKLAEIFDRESQREAEWEARFS